MSLEFLFHDTQEMSEDAISGFDRCCALATRTNAEFGAPGAQNSLCGVVVKGALTVRVREFGCAALHPTLVMVVQQGTQVPVGHFPASTESNATIYDMKDFFVACRT